MPSRKDAFGGQRRVSDRVGGSPWAGSARSFESLLSQQRTAAGISRARTAIPEIPRLHLQSKLPAVLRTLSGPHPRRHLLAQVGTSSSSLPGSTRVPRGSTRCDWPLPERAGLLKALMYSLTWIYGRRLLFFTSVGVASESESARVRHSLRFGFKVKSLSFVVPLRRTGRPTRLSLLPRLA